MRRKLLTVILGFGAGIVAATATGHAGGWPLAGGLWVVGLVGLAIGAALQVCGEQNRAYDRMVEMCAHCGQVERLRTLVVVLRAELMKRAPLHDVAEGLAEDDEDEILEATEAGR